MAAIFMSLTATYIAWLKLVVGQSEYSDAAFAELDPIGPQLLAQLCLDTNDRIKRQIHNSLRKTAKVTTFKG